MKTAKRFFLLSIVAAMSAMALMCLITGTTVACAEEESEVLSVFTAVLERGGSPVEVVTKGKRYEEGSQYFTDISIELSNGSKIVPEVNEGYGAGAAAFDFKGEGYSQIFYYASSGGSGGFGYFYVYECEENKTNVLFDFSKFPNIYDAAYGEDKSVIVSSNGQPVLCFPPNPSGENSADNTFKPEVTGVNYAEPAYLYTENRYRLNVWQKVIRSYQADVAGYIITVVDFKK